MHSFIYHQSTKNGSVGVDNITSDYGKVDIITCTDKYCTHRQIERRDNLVFMRIKKRYLEH